MINRLENQIINNSYEIISAIGHGGAGVVYKANQLNLNRVVAIKFLREDFLLDEESRIRFQREGKIMASLDHPRIARCYAFGFWEKLPFLVLEFLQGRSLRQVLNEKSLDLKDTVELGIQLIDALVYTHGQQIIHRDLKPENIFITDEHPVIQAKILDFGLARLVENERLTRSGLLIGSAAYMSPEQCEGKVAGFKSDIYSLCCILYECLAGKPPFVADNWIALLYMHKNEIPRSLCELLPETPEAVNQIIMRGLQKSPDSRYQDASDFRKSLVRLKTALDQGIELAADEAQAIPALKMDIERKSELSNSRKMKLLVFVLGLLALFSDPGPVVLLAGAISKSNAENLADWFHAHGRPRAALMLYQKCLSLSAQEDQTKCQRLQIKIANHALSLKDYATARAIVEGMLERVSKEESIDKDCAKKLFRLIEDLPVLNWNGKCFLGLRKMTDTFKYEPDLAFDLCFTRMIFESSASDGEIWQGLSSFFSAVMLSENTGTVSDRDRLLSWTHRHKHSFTYCSNLLNEILIGLEKPAAKPSSVPRLAISRIVNVCQNRHKNDEQEDELAILCGLTRSILYLKYLFPSQHMDLDSQKLLQRIEGSQQSDLAIAADILACQDDINNPASKLEFAARAAMLLRARDICSPKHYSSDFFQEWSLSNLTRSVNWINNCSQSELKNLRRELFLANSNSRDLFGPENGLHEILFAADSSLLQGRSAAAHTLYVKAADSISLWFGTFAHDKTISYLQWSKATTEFFNTVERISYLSASDTEEFMPDCAAYALRLKEADRIAALERLLEIAYGCGAWEATINCSDLLLARYKSGQGDRKSVREIYWKAAYSLMQLGKSSLAFERMKLLDSRLAKKPEERSWLARKKLVLSGVCRDKEISSSLRRESLTELEQISGAQSSMETLANILACRQALSAGDAECRAIIAKMLSLNKQAGLAKADRINNAFFLSSCLFSCGHDKAGIETIEQLSKILSPAELDLCKRTWYGLIAKSLEEEGKDAQALALCERGLALPTLGPPQRLGYTLLRVRCQRNLMAVNPQ